METDSVYRSYLLRLRRFSHSGTDKAEWRITLVEPGQSQELVFETIDTLCIYLAAQTTLHIPDTNGKEDSPD